VLELAFLAEEVIRNIGVLLLQHRSGPQKRAACPSSATELRMSPSTPSRTSRASAPLRAAPAYLTGEPLTRATGLAAGPPMGAIPL